MQKIREAIPESGLYLGVIDQLLTLEEVTPEDLQAVLNAGIETIRKTEELWFDDDGEKVLDVDDCMEEILQIAVEAMGDLKVSQSQLARVTALDFDGGNEVYMWLECATAEALGLEGWELDTGGESELYLVRSLDGILSLPALEVLNLDAYGWTDSPRDASVLLKCKALKAVKQSSGLDDATKAALVEAGVEVS